MTVPAMLLREPAVVVIAAQGAAQVEAGGLTGFVLDVVRTIGELGIALLVLVENLVPPIPSEVVLPFSGALVADGRFTFVGVVAAATLGSVAGAVLLYELGRRLGHDRVARGLAKVPLVGLEDVARGSAGTVVWNGVLVGAGVLLGRQWQTVEDDTRWLDVTMVVAVGMGLARLVQRRLRDA